MTQQKGSAHVIAIGGLVVLLIGALSFIFWQNFINQKETAETTVVATKEQSGEVKLPDMITYDPEVQITDRSDLIGLKDAPESFKEFIISSIGEENKATEQTSDCYSIFTVNKIYKQKYAIGGVSAGGDCAGGAAVLWGLVDNSWTDISGTQNIGFACKDLELHKVPSAIAGTTCYDPASPDFSRAYNQE